MSTGLESLERVQFKPGDVIFREGETSYHFFMIEEGQVEVLLENPREPKKDLVIAILGPGQPVGEFALITKKPRSAGARAKTACSLVKISEQGYQELLKDLPEWAYSLIQSLIERLKQTDEKIRQILVSSSG